jgi:hypothetical protein
MKKSLLLSTALLASAIAFSGMARADVSVDGYAEFEKDIVVWERSYSLYAVGILSAQIFIDSSAAESISVTNQRNDNQVFYFDPTGENNFTPDPLRNNAFFAATITGSINNNAGITQVNQDVGHMVNQANTVSAALNGTAFFAESQNTVEQQNNGNRVQQTGLLPTGGPTELGPALRRADIINSVNRNSGITQVNQNAGVATNQVNSVSLALSLGNGTAASTSAVAMSEADLGQWNINNRLTPDNVGERDTVKINRIIDSVNGNGGITSVNQNSGNMNNQGTVISFAGASSLASFTRPATVRQ